MIPVRENSEVAIIYPNGDLTKPNAKFQINKWLVVWTYPSEKYEFVSWDDDIPNIWENNKCSKPPTR